MCVPDDLRTEEAEEVAAARELEARDDLLRHGGATNEVAALEYGDGEAAASQVSGGDESVMATADDDSVPFVVGPQIGSGGG